MSMTKHELLSTLALAKSVLPACIRETVVALYTERDSLLETNAELRQRVERAEALADREQRAQIAIAEQMDALDKSCASLRTLLSLARVYVESDAQASEMLYGFGPRPAGSRQRDLLASIDAAISKTETAASYSKISNSCPEIPDNCAIDQAVRQGEK